jgi:hypothetical protein
MPSTLSAGKHLELRLLARSSYAIIPEARSPR